MKPELGLESGWCQGTNQRKRHEAVTRGPSNLGHNEEYSLKITEDRNLWLPGN